MRPPSPALNGVVLCLSLTLAYSCAYLLACLLSACLLIFAGASMLTVLTTLVASYSVSFNVYPDPSQWRYVRCSV